MDIKIKYWDVLCDKYLMLVHEFWQKEIVFDSGKSNTNNAELQTQSIYQSWNTRI